MCTTLWRRNNQENQISIKLPWSRHEQNPQCLEHLQQQLFQGRQKKDIKFSS